MDTLLLLLSLHSILLTRRIMVATEESSLAVMRPSWSHNWSTLEKWQQQGKVPLAESYSAVIDMLTMLTKDVREEGTPAEEECHRK